MMSLGNDQGPGWPGGRRPVSTSGLPPSAWLTFLLVLLFLAGLFFSGLFAVRGFGIAVGAHAGYDLLVGLL